MDMYIYTYTYIHIDVYIFIHIYMAVSRLCLYVNLSPVLFSMVNVLICCMSYVRDLVHAMCARKSLLCAGFSLCSVWVLG